MTVILLQYLRFVNDSEGAPERYEIRREINLRNLNENILPRVLGRA